MSYLHISPAPSLLSYHDPWQKTTANTTFLNFFVQHFRSFQPFWGLSKALKNSAMRCTPNHPFGPLPRLLDYPDFRRVGGVCSPGTAAGGLSRDYQSLPPLKDLTVGLIRPGRSRSSLDHLALLSQCFCYLQTNRFSAHRCKQQIKITLIHNFLCMNCCM